MRYAFLLFVISLSIVSFGQKKTTPKKSLPKTTPTKSLTKNNPKQNQPNKTFPLVVKKDTVHEKPVVVSAVINEKGAEKMNRRETDMIMELNYVRTNPKEYKRFVVDYLQRKRADTADARAAAELLSLLDGMRPVPALLFSNNLYTQAEEHGQWMLASNSFEHSEFNYAENLVAGVPGVRDATIELLIDSHDPGRGHRLNILHPSYKFVAVYEVKGKVADMENCFVQAFSFKR